MTSDLRVYEICNNQSMSKYFSGLIKAIGSLSSKSSYGQDSFKIIQEEEARKLYDDINEKEFEWIIKDRDSKHQPRSSYSFYIMHNGIRLSDQRHQITCLRYTKNPTDSETRCSIARNFVKRLKTLRHPRIIHYIDSVDIDDAIIVATEPIIPLTQYLTLWKHEKSILNNHTNHMTDIIISGIYQIATGIDFLHQSAGIIHGMIASLDDSVAVDIQTGDWKLSGFWFSISKSKSKDELSRHIQILSQHCPANWFPSTISLDESLDIFQFGKWIERIFDYIHEKIPPVLLSFQHQLFTNVTMSQWIKSASMPSSPFHNMIIQNMLIIESITIQDTKTKQSLLHSLENDMRIHYPSAFYVARKYTAGLIQAYIQGSLDHGYLGTILKLAQDMPKSAFQTCALPLLIDLLDGKIGSSIQNVQLKNSAILPNISKTMTTSYQLKLEALQALPSLLEKLDEKSLNDQLYPHIAIGWKDPEPVIREWTMRVVMELLRKLSSKIIHGDLNRQLQRLLADSHPGVRTNALICLGKMIAYWRPEESVKILIVAISKGLCDPFPPSRTASLNILRIALPLLNISDLSYRLMPLICPLIIDNDASIASLAGTVLIQSIQEVEEKKKSKSENGMVDDHMRVAINRLWFIDWALIEDKFEATKTISKDKLILCESSDIEEMKPDIVSKEENIDGWDDQFDFEENQEMVFVHEEEQIDQEYIEEQDTTMLTKVPVLPNLELDPWAE